MVSALTVLHLITNPILALPLLHLARPPRKGSNGELPGIRPIKVRVITPRRGLILTLLSALAFTSVLDTAVLVVDLLSGPHRPIEWYEDLRLVSWLVYTFGGFLVWALAAILAEWRTKWGNEAVAVMAAVGLMLEITNLPFLVIREIHTGGSRKIFTILAIPPSCLRILVLLTLVIAVSNPRVSFEDATESTGLLNGHGDSDEGEAGPSRGRSAYGTFEENGTPKPSSRGTSQQPGTATSGQQTPTPGGPAKGTAKITIPKKLGEKKEEDKPMGWKEFWPKLKKLSPHLWPSTSVKLQAYCLLCIGIVIVGRFLIPLVPITLGQVVRALSRNHGDIFGPSVWPPFITYFAVRAIMSGGLLDFVRQLLWVPVYQYTDREMMMLCFNHLLNLSLAYHTKRNTGEVMRIIDRGSAINNLFQTLLFTAIPTVIDIIVAFGVLYYLYGPTIALVTLATMVIYITVSFTMTRSRVRYRRELMDRDVKQRGIVNDVLTNWESVKYFTAEHRERDRFREAVMSYQETEAKWTITYSLLNLIQTFLLTLGLMVGSLIIAFRVIRGRADAAEFVVFLQYFQQLSRPLDNLGSLYRSLNTNTTDAEKMFNLLAQATEVNDKPGAKDLVVTDGIIEFKDVRFSYDGKVEALKGVSFTIGKGQSMALVGESGSGKSTILRLIYRFYDINSGTILIDGQDISQVTQLSLRRAIGIVPQDSVLWNDTIGANVGYGKEDATDEEIIEAALAAKLHERILSFPEQYSTVVGERGVRLSGGEKQRVSLARMFLKSPAILVLDEATSALDTETEREIQRALADLAKGRSSLSIAHRLSTIINSDQIVVMKDGQIVEHGAYKELLDINGAFAAMWKKQIHTDAEMVAEAEGDAEAVPEVKLIDDTIEDAPATGRGKNTQAEPAAEPAQTETGYSLNQQPSPTAPAATNDEDADDTPATYADAVKHHNREATIPEEHEPGSPDTARPTTVPPPQTATQSSEAAADTEDGSAGLLDKGKGRPESPSAPPSPAPVVNVPPPALPLSTPSKSRPTSFPVMPRQVSSNSVHSSPSGTSAPSRSTSYPNLAQSTSNSSQGHGASTSAGRSTPTDEQGKEKGGKARKRLKSIKGFVRRISDQGTGGLSRSNSTGRTGGLASPDATEGAGAANRPKRLSMPPRGKSSQE